MTGQSQSTQKKKGVNFNVEQNNLLELQQKREE